VDRETLAAEDSACLRAVANALTVDQGLIAFLRDLAPQWGSSTGKTRSYGGLHPSPYSGRPCILRVDSRAAILLNDALYSPEGPSKLASHLADALRHPEIDASGKTCTVRSEDLPPLQIGIQQYSDKDGNAVAPDSADFHHRVISIVPM
jgi:hypothetical protein